MKKINREELTTTLWSAGETTQIYIDPPEATVAEKNFNYRISTATCEEEVSMYTPYPGFWRYLTPLTGPMTIQEEERRERVEPFEVYSFSGSHAVSSNGGVRDFNLIFRDHLKAEMYTLCDMDWEYKAKTKTVIFKFDGDSTINGEEFPPFSAVEMEAGEEISLQGKGRHVICEMEIGAE